MVKFHNIFLNSQKVLRNEIHLSNAILIKLHNWNYLTPKIYPLIMDKLSCF